MMTELYPVDPGKLRKGRLFCGPAALCAITGLPGHEIVAMINAFRGKRAGTLVRSTDTDEIMYVLRRLGFSPRLRGVADKPTLGKLIEDLPAHKPHVIRVTDHFVAQLGPKVSDQGHRNGGVNYRFLRWRRIPALGIIDVFPNA